MKLWVSKLTASSSKVQFIYTMNLLRDNKRLISSVTLECKLPSEGRSNGQPSAWAWVLLLFTPQRVRTVSLGIASRGGCVISPLSMASAGGREWINAVCGAVTSRSSWFLRADTIFDGCPLPHRSRLYARVLVFFFSLARSRVFIRLAMYSCAALVASVLPWHSNCLFTWYLDKWTFRVESVEAELIWWLKSLFKKSLF